MPLYGLEEAGGIHRVGVGRQAVSAVHSWWGDDTDDRTDFISILLNEMT